jgi:hypothetical protein
MASDLRALLTKALREKMKTDARWAAWGLVAVYQGQTFSEQIGRVTVEQNGIGFNSLDAAFGSSMAEQASVWFNTPKADRKFPEPLSPKQGIFARKIAPKYAVQVAEFMLTVHPEVATKILAEVTGQKEAA